MVTNDLHTCSIFKEMSIIYLKALSKFVAEMHLAIGNSLHALKRGPHISVPIVMPISLA